MPTHDFVDIGDVLDYEILQGTIASIDPGTDTCTVNIGGHIETQGGNAVTVGGNTLSSLLFYHCKPDSVLRDNGAIQGAAAGFSVGDSVAVLISTNKSVVKVIAHLDGIRRCGADHGNFFVFYKAADGTTLNIAECKNNSTFDLVDTKTAAQVLAQNILLPETFLLKKFYHNYTANNITILKTMYFIATSIYINPNPSPGWVSFAASNPHFPLVTNNDNTNITETPQLLADLQSVNYSVNHAYSYQDNGGAGASTWQIMSVNGSGDCIDFALTKAQALLNMGYSASALHLEFGLYSPPTPAEPSVNGTSGAHGWLVVQTNKQDYALDLNRDTVIANSSMMFGAVKLYARRRQIGMNWAFMSDFSWLLATNNRYQDDQANPNGPFSHTYFYVLDPALNILYPIHEYLPVNGKFTMTVRAGNAIDASYNFSNDKIFLSRELMVSGQDTASRSLETYHLGLNELILDSAVEVNIESPWLNPYLAKDGSQLPSGNTDTSSGSTSPNQDYPMIAEGSISVYDYNCVAVGLLSRDGYFDYDRRYMTQTADYVYTYLGEIFRYQRDNGSPYWSMVLIEGANLSGEFPGGYETITSSSHTDTNPPFSSSGSSWILSAVFGDGVATVDSGASSSPPNDINNVSYQPNLLMCEAPARCYTVTHINGVVDVYLPNNEMKPILPATGGVSYPTFWGFIELSALKIQGLRMDIGGPRMYLNGTPCLDTFISAAGPSNVYGATTEDKELNIYGVAFIPMADRLHRQ